MRKKFEEAQISLIAFTAGDDVITTSVYDNLGGWQSGWDVSFEDESGQDNYS